MIVIRRERDREIYRLEIQTEEREMIVIRREREDRLVIVL